MPDFCLHFCCEADEEVCIHKLEHPYIMNLHALHSYNYTLAHKSKSFYELLKYTYSLCASSSRWWCTNVEMTFWAHYFNNVSHKEKSQTELSTFNN